MLKCQMKTTLHERIRRGQRLGTGGHVLFLGLQGTLRGLIESLDSASVLHTSRRQRKFQDGQYSLPLLLPKIKDVQL
jgi:hypothetical protein